MPDIIDTLSSYTLRSTLHTLEKKMLETGTTGLLVMLGFSTVFHVAHRSLLPITKLYSEVCFLRYNAYLVNTKSNILVGMDTEISYVLVSIQPLYNRVMQRKNGADWQNITISYIHAVVCSLWITYCLMTAGPELSGDLMHANVQSARLLLCMSSGYFLADSIDMIRTKTLSWDLALHHVVV